MMWVKDRPRQARILLSRGLMSAYECARRYKVDHTHVRRIWRGVRWTPEIPRARAIMMIQRDKGQWVPATRRDEELLLPIAGSGQSGRLADLVALCSDHGLAVVFRGDLDAAEKI